MSSSRLDNHASAVITLVDMSKWRMPPKAKVYEALSAVAGGRVTIEGPCRASVRSSSGDKSYSVEWSADQSTFTSNDNASYWQGYIGYPIVAVLLILGKLTYEPQLAGLLGGVHWKRINDEFKRDYDKAVAAVLNDVQQNGANTEAIVQMADNIYVQLSGMNLERGSIKKRPPSGKKDGGEQMEFLS